MKRCKVLGCDNMEMTIIKSAKHESMQDSYGYCQIHNIEGLVKEIKK